METLLEESQLFFEESQAEFQEWLINEILWLQNYSTRWGRWELLFQCCWILSFWYWRWISWFEDESFLRGENDKNYDVPYIPITRSKTLKIQQSLFLHVQEWIGSVHPQFQVPRTNTRGKGPFEALKVHVFSIEANYVVDIKFPSTQLFEDLMI